MPEPGTPHDSALGAEWRARSQHRRSLILSVVSWCSFAITLTGMVIMLFGAPPEVGSVTMIRDAEPGVYVLAVGVVLAAFVPALRPLAMAIRWARAGDYRYAAIAAAVVLVVAGGILIKY